MADKISSGIQGLDSILHGGYLLGRPTLIRGAPGTGKTILSLFFAHMNYSQGKKVVYLSCDESPDAIIRNLDSYHLDGTKAVADKTLDILDMRPNPDDELNGQYELSAVLFRIQNKIDKENPVLIIDSLQNLLFEAESENAQHDLFRLFSWARDNEVTMVITNVADTLLSSLKNLQDHAVDCVIQLMQITEKHLMTRYLQVLKMRGSSHGTNQYPFCLTEQGISLLPITSSKIDRHHKIEKISTGISELDGMLNGGFREETTITIAGSTGTAKTLFAASIAHASLKKGKKVLYISFEESENDIVHNVRSIGIDLQEFVDSKQLLITTKRSSEMGLEEHLIRLVDLIDEHEPYLFIIDPITSLIDMGTLREVKDVIVRFISLVKERNTTIIFTELLKHPDNDSGMLSISSIVDTMIMLDLVNSNGESNRMLEVVKSRGGPTSNQLKEFKVTNNGIQIEDPYIGEGGILFGSAKLEKITANNSHKKALESELMVIDSGVDTLNSYGDGEEEWRRINLELLKQKLVDRRETVKNTLASIINNESLNKKMRGSTDGEV